MVLSDTNILSELARHEPNPGVLAWAESVTSISISVITLEEVLYGLARRPNPRIRAWFEDFLAARCRILDITPEIARLGGQLRGDLAKKGQVRSQADMIIAATTQIHQLVLVTRNARDFEGCNIALLNPFS